MKNSSGFLLGAGFLSGIISVAIPVLLLLVVGIPYGIITGLYFDKAIQPTEGKYRLFLWIVASGISYFAGLLAVVRTSPQNLFPEPTYLNYALVGFVVATVLSIAFHFIFYKIHILYHIIIMM